MPPKSNSNTKKTTQYKPSSVIPHRRAVAEELSKRIFPNPRPTHSIRFRSDPAVKEFHKKLNQVQLNRAKFIKNFMTFRGNAASMGKTRSARTAVYNKYTLPENMRRKINKSLKK